MLKSWKKDNIKSIYIDRLDFDNFKQVILRNLIVGIRYSLLFKVKYNNSHFGMLGPQQGFKLINLDDLYKVELLYDDLIKRIENFKDKYNCDEIELIQILYIVLSENPKLKLTNINNIHLDRNLVKVKEIKDKFNFKFLPLTINTNYYGNLLVGEDYIFYLDKINKERELLGKSELDENNIDSMYLYNDNYIIINNINKDSVINRKIYSASSGILFENVIDNIINEKIFTRNISNVSITISKDKIINLEVKKNLSIIKYDSKFTKELANPFIGSLDLEAFIDLDGYAKIYAIGFAVLNGDIKTFYLQKDQNSNDLLLDCFNLLLNKYNGYIFYIHNFGKYDSIFILKILIEANKIIGSVYYKLEPVYKDDILLKLDIKVKNNKITIMDSYNLLNTGLYELSHSFNLDVTKGFFPHKFVKRDTLYYIGKVQGITIPNDVHILAISFKYLSNLFNLNTSLCKISTNPIAITVKSFCFILIFSSSISWYQRSKLLFILFIILFNLLLFIHNVSMKLITINIIYLLIYIELLIIRKRDESNI
jgi:DNA polymerase type B, organellar and viral